MPFKKSKQLRLGASMAALIAVVQPAYAETFQFHAEHVLGTSLDFQAEARSQGAANLAFEAALAEIKRLESLFSTWSDVSEISRLNQERHASVSVETANLLERCEYWREETQGALDCRLGDLINTWHNNTSPAGLDNSQLDTLLRQVKSTTLSIKGDKASLTGNASLRVDALAKGVILDAAANAAQRVSPDIQGVLVNIGGDIRTVGRFGEKGVRVGVAGPNASDAEAPAETIWLTEGAIASSGASGRDIKIGARKASHIISPFTGRPQDIVETVTVVAPTAEAADALATAFAVTGVANSLGYANTHDGVETVIITRGGSRFASDGWSNLRAEVETLSAEAAGVENPWQDDWSLEVGYEIPKVDASDYEYPYVVAWITDAENKPVRHLLMLGDSPRWLEENYVHWLASRGPEKPCCGGSYSKANAAAGAL